MNRSIDDLRVRSFGPNDVESLARIANNPNVASSLRDRFPQPYEASDAASWIEFSRAGAPETQFAIEQDGELVGCIGLELQTDIARRTAEIGFFIGEPYWGRGIATKATRCVTDFGFGDLGLVRIYAQVLATNSASARVLEKAGYQREAVLRQAVFKHNQILDAFLYARIQPNPTP